MTKEKCLEVCGYIRELIKGTEFENHVFAVGGCVRDEVMGKEPKDVDIVLDLPQGGIDFAKWLEEKQYSKGSVVIYPTYGTAMLHLQAFPDVELEFVHTRKEQYKNATSRNPDTEYGTLEEDALRRDLTINALYRNLSTGEYVDPTGKGIPPGDTVGKYLKYLLKLAFQNPNMTKDECLAKIKNYNIE